LDRFCAFLQAQTPHFFASFRRRSADARWIDGEMVTVLTPTSGRLQKSGPSPLSSAETITIREGDIVLPPVPADRTAVKSTAMEFPDPGCFDHRALVVVEVVERMMHAANRLSFAKDVASLTRTYGRISAIQRCTVGSR
jgi:hypothetical protein